MTSCASSTKWGGGCAHPLGHHDLASPADVVAFLVGHPWARSARRSIGMNHFCCPHAPSVDRGGDSQFTSTDDNDTGFPAPAREQYMAPGYGQWQPGFGAYAGQSSPGFAAPPYVQGQSSSRYTGTPYVQC